MKKIEKYLGEALQDQDVEDLTRHLVKNKFDREAKIRWKQKLKEDYQIERSDSHRPPGKRFTLGPKLMAIAACFLMLVAAFWVYKSTPETSLDYLVAQHLDKDNLTYNVARKDTANRPPVRQKFSEAFNQGDYALAAQMGEEMLNSVEVNADDYFFLGLCYLHLNQLSLSINNLETAKEQVGQQGRFADEMNWFLSLAYIQNEDWEEARDLLTQIISEQAWRFEEAARILDELPEH